MKFLFSFFLLINIQSTFCQIINIENAKAIAANIFSEIKSVSVRKVKISNDFFVKETNNQPIAFIFNEQSGGFVILSAERRVAPILAYSAKGAISTDSKNWNPEFSYWVQLYFDQIEYVRQSNSPPSTYAFEKWNKLETTEGFRLSETRDVSPLLITTWNQGCGYNTECPIDAAGPCAHTYTGCAATAMAQILKYMEYPSSGVGSFCYTSSNYGQLCANFASTSYNYTAMPNNSGNAEVAKLMYHCGISVSMNYAPTASSAYTSDVPNALKKYFNYQNMVYISKNSYTNENWNKTLRNEIDNNRPIFYSGNGPSGGHAFVLDGYQNLDYFHINWGWSGSQDGYFYLNDLSPGSFAFNSNQLAVVGMIPKPNFTGLDVSSVIDLTCSIPISVDISTGVNYVNYYKNTYPAAVGKELVYRFTTSSIGRIKIQFSNKLGGDIYAFLLKYPHQDSLITYDFNNLDIDNANAGTYYLVIEGYVGAEPTFDLELKCPNNAELTSFNSSISPTTIEPNLSNVAFKTTVKNTGYSTAASNTIEYFISDNNIFEYGTDAFIGSDIVPALNPQASSNIETVLTIPSWLTSGLNKTVFFVVDRNNIIPEFEEKNISSTTVNVMDTSIINCNPSINLDDRVWYWSNTETNGANAVEKYAGWNSIFNSSEIIHSFIPQYNGIAKLSLSEKLSGNMVAFVLPECNEFNNSALVWIQNSADTLSSVEFYVNAGNEYYVVVDAEMPTKGNYGVMVELPYQCPSLPIEIEGDTIFCVWGFQVQLATSPNYSNYQWYENESVIYNATSYYYTASSEGLYSVKVTENNCTSTSNPVSFTVIIPPDATIISNDPLEFCYGESSELQALDATSDSLNWTKNGELIIGATNNTFTATEPGYYSIYMHKGICSSELYNGISITVKKGPVEIDEEVPIPSDSIMFYYPFTTNNYDESSNCNVFYLPAIVTPTTDRNNNAEQARDFTQNDQILYADPYCEMPNQFTLSLWFKTNTNEGGNIASFVDNGSGNLNTGIVLYMSNNGKLHFYLGSQSNFFELSSLESYNDGEWHNVLIIYNEGMLMEIDGGNELLQNTNQVSISNFYSYWSFASSSLLTNIFDMPSSSFFKGYLDDLLYLKEAKYIVRNYLDTLPLLNISIQGNTEICDSGLVNFKISPSQNNILYKVWNSTLNQWHSSSQIGNGDDILIIGINPITQTTTFSIYAINASTLCDRYLDSIYTVTVNNINASIIAQNESTLIANIAGAQYQWINCNNNNAIIEGETNQSFTAIENGYYAVIINQNNCIDTSACYSITGVDIQNLNKQFEYKIYPNPTKDKITIETNEPTNLNIYNIVGEIVYQSQAFQTITQHNLTMLSTGIYYLQITTKYGTQIYKKLLIGK